MNMHEKCFPSHEKGFLLFDLSLSTLATQAMNLPPSPRLLSFRLCYFIPCYLDPHPPRATSERFRSLHSESRKNMILFRMRKFGLTFVFYRLIKWGNSSRNVFHKRGIPSLRDDYCPYNCFLPAKWTKMYD